MLKILDLYRNHIGDEGARAIADALHSNSVLVKLVIGNQRIGNKGALAFADALERDDDPALRELNLSKNRIGAEGAAALAHAMMRARSASTPSRSRGSRRPTTTARTTSSDARARRPRAREGGGRREGRSP